MEKIQEFFDQLTLTKGYDISRGKVLDLLAGINQKWSFVIRALILGKTDDKDINIVYLQTKVNFCRNHPENPEGFLDYHRTMIFKALIWHY